MSSPGGTLAGKKMELLKEAAPRARQIGLLAPVDSTFSLEPERQKLRANHVRWPPPSIPLGGLSRVRGVSSAPKMTV
jgi:hypothetical protein